MCMHMCNRVHAPHTGRSLRQGFMSCWQICTTPNHTIAQCRLALNLRHCLQHSSALQAETRRYLLHQGLQSMAHAQPCRQHHAILRPGEDPAQCCTLWRGGRELLRIPYAAQAYGVHTPGMHVASTRPSSEKLTCKALGVTLILRGPQHEFSEHHAASESAVLRSQTCTR